MSYQLLFNERCLLPNHIASEYFPLCGKAIDMNGITDDLTIEAESPRNLGTPSPIQNENWQKHIHISYHFHTCPTIYSFYHSSSSSEKFWSLHISVYFFRLKLEMCRLHLIALHGFPVVTLTLFHFARGCCNGSNSRRREPSRWTCSGWCAILLKEKRFCTVPLEWVEG